MTIDLETLRAGLALTIEQTNLPLGEKVAARYTGPVTDETRPFIHAAGEKRFAVRVHVERTVSWDHSKLGGTY